MLLFVCVCLVHWTLHKELNKDRKLKVVAIIMSDNSFSLLSAKGKGKG